MLEIADIMQSVYPLLLHFLLFTVVTFLFFKFTEIAYYIIKDYYYSGYYDSCANSDKEIVKPKINIKEIDKND